MVSVNVCKSSTRKRKIGKENTERSPERKPRRDNRLINQLVKHEVNRINCLSLQNLGIKPKNIIKNTGKLLINLKIYTCIHGT